MSAAWRWLRHNAVNIWAALAIAYLLTPLTDRIERLGVNRLAAALLIITLVVLAFVYLILLVAPILGGQLSSFIESVPGYATKLQTLLSDPSRPRRAAVADWTSSESRWMSTDATRIASVSTMDLAMGFSFESAVVAGW